MKDCKNLQRFLDGSLESTENASFEAHLSECASCSREVANARIVQQSLSEHARLEAAAWRGREAHLQGIKDRLEASRPSARKTLPRAVSLLVAASIAVVIGVIFWNEQSTVEQTAPRLAVQERAPEEPPAVPKAIPKSLPTWETAANATRLVHFEGHQIGLDGASRVEVASVQPRQLALRLVRGTAAFKVARLEDPGAFIVETTDLNVRVVGTRFSVAHTDDTTAVVVNRGAVDVTESDTQTVHRVSAGSAFLLDKSTSGKSLARSASPGELQRVDLLLQIQSEKAIPTPKRARPAKRDAKETPALMSITEIKKMIARGELSKADLELSRHLTASPMSVDANALRGDLRQKERRWQEAVDSYRRAGRAPGTKAARRSLYKAGVLLQEKLKDHSAAVALFEQYVRHQSTGVLTADALLRQAKSLGALGRQGEKKSVLQRLVAEHPGTPAALSARKLLTTP